MPSLPVRDLRSPRPVARVRGRRVGRGAAAGLAVALSGLAPLGASAQGQPPPAPAAPEGDRAAADAWFQLGLARERAGDFAGALEAYDACAEEAPSAQRVPAARARAKELRDRAEGGFVPLGRLRAFLALPAPSEADAAALGDAAAGFPDGRVRAEARLAAAVALRHRLGRADLAEPLLRAAHADASAERTTRALALSELVSLLRARKAAPEALRLARADPSVAPALVAELAREVRRDRVTVGAHAALAAFLAVGLASFAVVVRRERGAGPGSVDRAVRAVAPPLAVAAMAWIALGAAALVRVHGGGDPKPFLLVGLAGLPVVLAARAWHVAARPGRPAGRVLRAAAAALAALALGVVALARSDVRYLESFGW